MKEIEVQDLGPIREASFQLGRLNLIYGRNERGKTYVVEFVIRSLFRNPKLWPLREQSGRGRVTVEGLSPEGLVKFSPTSSPKLEDFWEESRSGLPADFSKLLVVKGAEVELSSADGGVDKAILKRLLSSREILDQIEKRISKTIQDSRFDHGVITGPRRGEISARAELEQRYRELNRLFDRLEREYSGGPRHALIEEKNNLQSERDKQLQAKRYLAFTLDQEIKALRQRCDPALTEKLDKARNKMTLYNQKLAEYRKKQEDQKHAEERSRHYDWLNSAESLYQKSLQEEVTPPRPIFIWLTAGCVVAAGVLAFFGQPLLAALCLAGVLGFGFVAVQKYQELARRAPENAELERLRQEFKKLFGKELTGLPLLTELRKGMEEDYNSARLLKHQLNEDFKELYNLKLQISESIAELAGEQVEPKRWNEIVRGMQAEQEKLESEIREKELALARLSVAPADYVEQHPQVEYSPLKLESLEDALARVQRQIDEATAKLDSLKHEICAQTGDDISVSWETLIEHLREKHEEVLERYKQKTAEIVGKLAVLHVIKELRKTEDSKILAGLKTPKVEGPLLQLTNRYRSVTLEGERLLVEDSHDSYYLSQLSTGAQEQVLLALRIGFASKLLGQNHLFLIFDDAFQYSDWERRPRLVDKAVQLAQDGWQILYFTMDDHIRDLFHQRGSLLGEEYRYFELSGEFASR